MYLSFLFYLEGILLNHFEALFLQTVLKQMRSASDVLAPEDSPLSSNKQGAFRDMHDQTVAQSLAGQGQVGIAAMIERQLDPEKAGEAAKALREMRSRDATARLEAMYSCHVVELWG